MKRIQHHRYGGPEEMRLETFEVPAPGKDEIVAQVKASSVNPVDWKMRQGALSCRRPGVWHRSDQAVQRFRGKADHAGETGGQQAATHFP